MKINIENSQVIGQAHNSDASYLAQEIGPAICSETAWKTGISDEKLESIMRAMDEAQERCFEQLAKLEPWELTATCEQFIPSPQDEEEVRQHRIAGYLHEPDAVIECYPRP
jgi:hypothetical protein